MTLITRNTRRPMVGRRSARILAGGSLIVCLFAVDPFLLAQAGVSNEHWVGTWTTAVVGRPPQGQLGQGRGQAPQGQAATTPPNQPARQTVNEWIRTGKAYDGVIDFDAVLRDPAQPTKFAPKYDSGDHLHPNDAGYELMANTINLEMLARRPAAPQTAGR